MFAGVEPTPEAILSFAERFGLLGADITKNIELEKFEGRVIRSSLGDAQHDWLAELRAMKRAVTLWDAVREEDEWALQHHVRWEKKSVYVLFEDDDPPGFYQLAHTELEPESFARIRKGGTMTAARLGVREIINEHLWELGRVAPTLLMNDDDELEPCLRPQGLIGAIWLDFMLAVGKKVEFRACLHCNTPFAVAPKGKRRRFCSNKCRVAHHRATHAKEEQA